MQPMNTLLNDIPRKSLWRCGVCGLFLLLLGCAGQWEPRGHSQKGGKTGHPTQRRLAALQPLRTVEHVDLERYMGDWYVIANIPYFAERDCYESVESYSLRADGRIDNGFAYRKGSFDAPLSRVRALAWVDNLQTNAEWRVRFFGLFTAKYLVLDLDRDYRWAVVGHPSRNYGWILARAKTLPEGEYRGILKRLESQGYDSTRFVMVPQVR
jgi:apolipoprotein D and lipocalin family protein